MYSSPAASNGKSKIAERRGFPRETLKFYVVLVYFGEDNWGKLIDMSESGMSFEFAKPPSLRERINFNFQAMGCMGVPPEGGIFGRSFEATGEIVWTREFERIAGVQFVDLTEASREQIRQWLSFEACTSELASAEEAGQETPALPEDLVEPPTCPPETQNESGEERPLTDFDASEPPAKPAPELESPLPKEIPRAWAFDEQVTPITEHQGNSAPSDRPTFFGARLAFLVILGGLAALAVTAGLRMILTREADQAGTVERALSPVAEASRPRGAKSSSSADTSVPFRVDVSDASGAHWILSFAPNGSKNALGQVASKLAMSSNSASATKGGKRKDAVPAKKAGEQGEFTMVAPRINTPADNGATAKLLSADVPNLPSGVTVAQEPIGGGLTSEAVPAPVAPSIGGLVQQARLIKSIPPVYPALARASRVSGDVVLDALIDAAGNVASMKAVSGPILLRSAAAETLRQWKYDPARLDGKPVAMHLSVTVRFRLN